MAAVIHPKWHKPMPRWWHDFYERDAAIFDEPMPLSEAVTECVICGADMPSPRPRQTTCGPICRRKFKTEYNRKWSRRQP